MEEEPDHRDNDNNWVIPNTEALLVETVGAAHDESPPSHEATAPPGVPAPAVAAEGPVDTEASGREDVKGPEPPPLTTELPPPQEKLEIPPEEEPESRAEEEPQPGLRRRVAGYIEKLAHLIPDPLTLRGLRSWGRRADSATGAELEEVSCSSSDDDVEGLRKRAVRGAPPTTSVGAAAREAEQLEPDAGSSLILNKCIIAAIALVGLAVLVLTGGFGGADDDSPESVLTRSVSGGAEPPQAIADIQEWIRQHAAQFSGDPSSLQVMNSLLDKVANENQEIRHMQATLQAQKEELEALLHAGSEGSPGTRVTEENVRLKDALLREETGHLTAKEELQNLQEKLDTLEADSQEKEALISENSQLKAELETSKRQMESFLTQKETLVAESQMLRQELDKQRQLVATIKQDLEAMTANKTGEEDEKALQDRIRDMGNKLAMEAQRSQSWEKTYVEHAQKRKELVGEERKVHGHKEWKKGDKAEGQVKRQHAKHGRDHGRRWEEDGQKESQHEEWKSKKHEDKQQWREKKHRHWEEENEHHPHQDKAKEHRFKDSPQHESGERNWRDKHSHHHHGEPGDGFHPRKGQKEFSEAHKHGEDKRKEHGDKAHGKEHRHHDHNKFWKKLSDHQYRVPTGCSGLEDCARKDGIDLFNAELKPVERKRFEDVLKNYLAKSELSKNLPDLVPLLDGFFEGPHFAHHKIRFKDFVDDVEDFLEDLARKETGSDDIVDDFEKFVYASFFGDAAIKKRYAKKEEHRQHNPGNPEETQSHNQTNPRYHKDKRDFRVDTESRTYKPYKGGKYDHDRPHDKDWRDPRWKKQKKYDHDARRNQNNNNNSQGFDQNLEERHLESKYNQEDLSHDYRSQHEHGEGHRDREGNGGYFHEHKSYKKHGENRDWREDHPHKDKSDGQHKRHSHGKHQPDDDCDEDTEQSHQPKHKKHQKDAFNERYRASEPHDERQDGRHHEHQKERYHSKPHYDQDDDDRHKHHPDYKPYYDKKDNNWHKHHHGKNEYYDHKPYYDKDKKHHHDKNEDYDHKPYYDKDKKHHHDENEDYDHKPYSGKDNQHKHHHDKNEDYDHKPYYDKKDKKHHHGNEENHDHKPYYGKDNRHKHHHKNEDYDHKPYDDKDKKPHHGKEEDHDNKPYYKDNQHKHHHDKNEDYDHKPYYDKKDKKHHHNNKEDYDHKPYYEKKDKKHHHDQEEDYDHKPYYERSLQDGNRPYSNKQDKHKPHHEKYDGDKHRSSYEKHSRGSSQDEDRKHEDGENPHGSSYDKQDHHYGRKKY